jgi:NitT/TauT family transport system ATP-binding protein
MASTHGGGACAVTDALLEIDHLRYRFDGPSGTTLALDDVSISVESGELVSIVGPSGSGKTTLLRCVAGLLRPTGGEVRVDGIPVAGVPGALAVVFQDYARSLFPWMTVRDNVELPLRHADLPEADREGRVRAALGEVGLGEALDRYPWQLSGGMQQRVAIARAIAYRPRILLMDEPFASVDAQTRAELQDLTLEVAIAHGSTVLFVTHDIDEAIYLADRVVVLSEPPTTVAAAMAVALPRPRDQIETRAAAAFVDLRSEVARLLRRGTPQLMGRAARG